MPSKKIYPGIGVVDENRPEGIAARDFKPQTDEEKAKAMSDLDVVREADDKEDSGS